MNSLSWMRWALLSVVPTGCFHTCETPTPSGDTELWIHDGASAFGADCLAKPDERERNDEPVEANLLGWQDACIVRTVVGRVADDVDAFYAWGGRCEESSPKADLREGPDDLRFCLFVSCVEGKAGLEEGERCSGGAAYHTVEGLLGCCRTGPGAVSVHVNCDADFTDLGNVDELDSFVIVDRTSGAECVDYAIDIQL